MPEYSISCVCGCTMNLLFRHGRWNDLLEQKRQFIVAHRRCREKFDREVGKINYARVLTS